MADEQEAGEQHSCSCCRSRMTRSTAHPGTPEPLGVVLDATGANVAVHSAHAEAIAVCLFDAADTETARIRLPARTGDVFHGHIPGVAAGTRYGLRAFGPWDPARGHRFNPAKLLVDPFATALDRPFRLDPALFDRDEPNLADTAALMPKAIMDPTLSAAASDRPVFHWDGQVIYELHVRGFTMRHPDIPPALRGTFAGLAHPAAVAHLTALGVTAVELMPSAAWVDERHLPPLGLSNYWGYNPVALLVPDPRLAPGGWGEVARAVATLQSAGIAVLLDVVLNHTGEGDHLGPTLSLRGLDNVDYYRLLPDDRAHYADDAGCGNTLALDRPPALRLAMEALRTWALRGGVDGFRLDLATTLGRRPNGFDPTAPLLAAIEQDPILCRRVMIAEPWDIGPGGYQLGAFPARWGEWNDRYRDTMRRFWRGDPGMLGDAATRFAGSADVFAPRCRPLSRSLNLITAHDGFTLADLVSFQTKRNQANGEENRDGTSDNLSWNHGNEGATDDPAIVAARRRDARALLATLLLSRGTPMLSMGDEVGRTQQGNNNAYAQDNEISWLDWPRADEALRRFASRLIAARARHSALHWTAPLTGAAIDDTLVPDVSWHRPDGGSMAQPDWTEPENRTLIAALYARDDRVLVILHATDTPTRIIIPSPRAGRHWRLVIDSSREDVAEEDTRCTDDHMVVPARSVLLLTEAAGAGARRDSSADSAVLDRLAREAGLASAWWDVDGHLHQVTDDTKRALLSGMQLPAETRSDAADSLARLAALRGAPVPPVLIAAEGAAISVPLRGRKPAWLTLVQACGTVTRIPVPPDDPPAVILPPMPTGRHRVLADDHTDAACHLIVAPRGCFLPPDLAAGQRRFGVAAHLYTLRRAGDQGIGDFTTLAELAAATARHGAATIGLNPLHALFPQDRGRASPYHPSDRRFLDPIYIDVSAFPGGCGTEFAPLAAPSAVNYPGVWAAKDRVLRAAFDRGGDPGPVLDAFIAAGGDALRAFTTFQAISTITAGQTRAGLGREPSGGKPVEPVWPHWPEGLRHPGGAAVARFAADHAREVRYAAFLQYLGDMQMRTAAQTAANAGLSLGFYRDLAVGAAPDGAEAWSRQDTLVSGASIGAPPDPFAASGQVWCLPPPNPLAWMREGYAGFGALLAANMRHAGALRIDHVMGLQRLFLVPEGASAGDGTYLDFPLRDLLGVVALESQRAGCLVVGEDLGTVPEGFSAALTEARILSYSVLWFERDKEAFRPPASWSRWAAACVSTHDLPTLAGWWQGEDIREQHALGLLDGAAHGRAVARRQVEKRALLSALGSEHLLPEGAGPSGPLIPTVAAAIHAFVARSPTALALIQADDLAGETEAVNLPGTDRERPNWRRRLRLDVDALCGSPLAAMLWQAMRAQQRTSLAD